jgi:NaMN:DMB phosphoribosyltransferase
VVREGVGAGGEMTQALHAHMNNKRKKKEERREGDSICTVNVLT